MENYCFGTLVFEMDMLNKEHGFFPDHIVREKMHNLFMGISNNLDRAPLKTKKFEAVEVLKTAVYGAYMPVLSLPNARI